MTPAGGDLLAVVDEDVLGLGREVEDHVHVQRLEVRRRLPDALEYLLGAAVLVVAVHLAQKLVVEGLHAHGKALDTALQLVQIAGNEMVRVRLGVDLLDGEQVAGVVDGLA